MVIWPAGADGDGIGMVIVAPGEPCEGIVMVPCWVRDFSIGMFIGEPDDGLLVCAATARFDARFSTLRGFLALLWAAFVVGVFAAGAFFAGIGIVMPGMFMCCAVAGAESGTRTMAPLAAMSNVLVTSLTTAAAYGLKCFRLQPDRSIGHATPFGRSLAHLSLDPRTAAAQ